MTADLWSIAVSDAHDAYDLRGIGGWSDAALGEAVGSVLAIPKVAPADSFVLHSPLELLARLCLLARIEPSARQGARRRLLWLAASYEAAGPGLPRPRLVEPAQPIDDVARRLVASLEAGDLDDIDRYAAALGAQATPSELRQLLGRPVAASLAAAAHGSIYLSLLPRAATAGGPLGSMLRGLARDLGRHPDWRLRWFEDPDEPSVTESLADALLAVPMLGSPGSNTIHPLMCQAEESGLASKLASGILRDGPVDVGLARAQLSRIAAWSMLEEPNHHAYGWSHCMTMPQAVLALAADTADPGVAVAVAATHVIGFRAALGERSLEPLYEPEPVAASDLGEAMSEGPATAAAYAWHASTDPIAIRLLEASLASRAAPHHDAHYAKYTLACFDAADADPSHERLYLAAAAFLGGYWALEGDDAFFAT